MLYELGYTVTLQSNSLPEVTLRLAQGQIDHPVTNKALASAFIWLLYDHLGVLARSAAFPEVSPIMSCTVVSMHLK